MTDLTARLNAALEGRYSIERELGEGGMATVYLARDLKHDRDVALKVLSPELASAVGAERFLSEIRTTANLQHPHILPLFDSGEASGLLWFAMPWIDGGTLRLRMSREGALPVSDALTLARDIASALDHAHRQGVIHRDVKPENILLHGEEAILGDFGVAHAIELAAAGGRLTETGLTLGTPHYMSPEQATGERTLDGRSDLYSLGCVLYEMLAGEPPFTAATARAIVAKVLTQKPVALSALREVSPEVDRLVERCLARSPADRFATAGQLTAALDAALAPSTTEPVRPSPRSRRRVAAVLGVAAIGTAAWLWSRIAPAPSEVGGLDPSRVAVGTFQNETGDTTLASLGHMAADWVSRGLARTGAVKVLDPGVIYANGQAGASEEETPLALARRNGAGLVVAGRFYQSGDSVLFTASVLDASDGTVLRTLDAVGAPKDHALAAVEDLRQRLASALVATTRQEGSDIIAPTVQPPTYEAYRQFVVAQEAYWRGEVRQGVTLFRRTLETDTTFLTAAVWVVAGAATINQCELADSVAAWLEPHRDELAASDETVVDGSLARCDGDWARSAEFMRRRAALDKGSTVALWSLAANLRRAGQPAEAASILQAMDPAHDLGWMSDQGKVFYWRDLLWSELMMGDTAAANRSVAAMARVAPGRLSTAYFTSLAASADGRPADAVRALEGVESLPPDPPLLIGEIMGTQLPNRMATPGRVLYQVSADLALRGDTAESRTLLHRATAWLEHVPDDERAWPETRYNLALALELAGRVDSALVVLRPAISLDVRDPEYLGRLGALTALSGDLGGAQAVDDRLARFPRVHPAGGPAFARAEIAAASGRRAEAIQLLRTLPFGSLPVDPFGVRSDPVFTPLRNDPTLLSLIGAGG